MGLGRGWQPRPELQLREAAPSELAPPFALRLSGEPTLESARKCLGVFVLSDGRGGVPKAVHERPVWQHGDRRQLVLAFSGAAWYVQKVTSIGSEAGLLCLDDTACASPELSRGSWMAAAGGWQMQPMITCTECELPAPPLPPPHGDALPPPTGPSPPEAPGASGPPVVTVGPLPDVSAAPSEDEALLSA